eukprot:CAMPEP_0116047922 /NCGR_PEP_ID=MMETSP0321-20121206/29232_1 /TAXON_ID=163516 /ORGANISM="Leptocylindrus danicus var. danicus, Strain B650" /LENGTH=45 /DNA_ID= /DNA_START= /DNA_END= /DNA_ORIENTATION=
MENSVCVKDSSEESLAGGYILYKEKEQSSADLHTPTKEDANRDTY